MELKQSNIIIKYKNKSLPFTESDWSEFNDYHEYFSIFENEHRNIIEQSMLNLEPMFDKELHTILLTKLSSLSGVIQEVEEEKNSIVQGMKHQRLGMTTAEYEFLQFVRTFGTRGRLESLQDELARIKLITTTVGLRVKIVPKRTSFGNFDAQLAQAKQVPIESLIGRDKVKRVGNRITICCPFHNEKTPSCSVDIKKNLFHCFGCGEGGDVIKFVEELYKLDFKDGVSFLVNNR